MENNNLSKTKRNPTPINSAADFADIVSDPGGDYILTANITVDEMLDIAFSGTFNGDGKTIFVEIDEDAQNVGLFSQLDGGQIHNLVIEGSVIGGPSSLNVGGLVGLVSSGAVYSVTNLSNVTGAMGISSVGGIVGTIFEGGFHDTVNNGIISTGKDIGGICGSSPSGIGTINVGNKNAGTLQNATHSMGGIMGYSAANHTHIGNSVNIGRLESRKTQYAGGIIAYIGGSGLGGYVANSSNSGSLDGAIIAAGGLVGYLRKGSVVTCINTNWIEPIPLGSVGAIVGENNSMVEACYYDKQMCIVDGIGINNPIIPPVIGAVGRLTTEMIGDNLNNPLIFWGHFKYEENLYPRPHSWNYDHPISLLSAAPIYLRNAPPPPQPPFETLENVQTNFTVSNEGSFAPGSIVQIEFPYQWGWYVGGFVSSSARNFISVTPPTNNIAAIVVLAGMGGWDELAVRLMDDDIGYEKIIPINVRP